MLYNCKEDSLSELSIKHLRHILFDLVPSLSQELKSENSFHSFLKFINEKKIKINWMLHLYFLEWLINQNKEIATQTIKELLIAAATRWLLNGLDHINKKALLIATPMLLEAGVSIRKSLDPEKAGQIKILKIPNKYFPKKMSYLTTNSEEYWSFDNWVQVPDF